MFSNVLQIDDAIYYMYSWVSPSETTMKYFYSDLSPSEAKHQRLKRLKSRRKVWLDVHLWLGLILGFFLALFCVTGSILVFYEEIDVALNAHLHKVQAPPQGEAAFRPLDEIQAAAAAAAMPAQAKLAFVDYPADAESAYEFGYTTPADAKAKTDDWQVHVDPYRAKVLGKHLIKKAEDILPRAFIPFVFQLHYALLAGETGVIIVGIMGVILLFSVLTGLIVWWPLTGHLAARFDYQTPRQR